MSNKLANSNESNKSEIGYTQLLGRWNYDKHQLIKDLMKRKALTVNGVRFLFDLPPVTAAWGNQIACKMDDYLSDKPENYLNQTNAATCSIQYNGLNINLTQMQIEQKPVSDENGGYYTQITVSGIENVGKALNPLSWLDEVAFSSPPYPETLTLVEEDSSSDWTEDKIVPNVNGEWERCWALDKVGNRCHKQSKYWVGTNGVDDFILCCAEHLQTLKRPEDKVEELK